MADKKAGPTVAVAADANKEKQTSKKDVKKEEKDRKKALEKEKKEKEKKEKDSKKGTLGKGSKKSLKDEDGKTDNNNHDEKNDKAAHVDDHAKASPAKEDTPKTQPKDEKGKGRAGSQVESDVAVPAAASAVSAELNSDPVPSSASSSNFPAGPSVAAEVKLSHHHMLLEARFADVVFVLNNGKSYNAHSFVLGIRCQKLFAIANKKKVKKPKKTTVELKETTFNPDSFQTVLEFVYCDEILLTKYPPEAVLSLCVAAHYFELPRLARLCEEHLKSVLTMENVFGLLKGAHESQMKRVKAFCLDFAHKNIKEFIKRKADAQKLGVELFQEVVSMSLEDYNPPPPDNTPIPPSTLISDFTKLYQQSTKGETSDASVTCSGERIVFHKAVLAGHSKGFLNLMLQKEKDDDLTDALALKDMGAASFKSMLKFVYYGDTTIDPLIACDLAPFSKRFELHELQAICENVISSNVSTANVLSILRVAYLPENNDREEMKLLRNNCLAYMTENVQGVSLDPLMDMEPRIAVDILRTWQKSVAK